MIHGDGRYTWPGAKTLRGRKAEEMMRCGLVHKGSAQAFWELFVDEGFRPEPVLEALKDTKGNAKAARKTLVKSNEKVWGTDDNMYGADDDWFEGTFEFGQRMSGKFKEGSRREGGLLDASGGTVYFGELDEHGQRHDQQAEMITFSGDRTSMGVFQGVFVHGQRTTGRFTWPTGDRFEGTFVDGAFLHGTYTYFKPKKQVRNNLQNSLRLFRSNLCQFYAPLQLQASAVKYEGQFCGTSANDKHGVGELWWVDGSKYKGGFRRNKLHGAGVYTDSDGRVYKGQWKHGCAEIKSSDGATKITWGGC